MARVIGNFKFEHPQYEEFIARTRMEVSGQNFFNQMRWYIGSTNINFGVGQLAEEFLLRDWIKPLKNKVLEFSKEPNWRILREFTYCTSGAGSRGVPFTASNYLDSVTRRYHYVHSGTGYFKSKTQRIGYIPGDIIEFQEQDYDLEWVHQFGISTEQLVFCLGHADQRSVNNWELFAQAIDRRKL